jgi:hypothetical protein
LTIENNVKKVKLYSRKKVLRREINNKDKALRIEQ